jgi:predicted GIY-YIG superfamily endonuclease
MPKFEGFTEAFMRDYREHKVSATVAYGGALVLSALAWTAYHDKRERAHNAEA